MVIIAVKIMIIFTVPEENVVANTDKEYYTNLYDLPIIIEGI